MKQTVLIGDYRVLGANWDGQGVNFALFSAHAEKVEVCIYDATGQHETGRFALPAQTHNIWHGYIAGLSPGCQYGYRVYGPHDPNAGHRFNQHKLLIDPYARLLAGKFQWHDSHFGYQLDHPDRDLSRNLLDNAAYMPKCVVVTPTDQHLNNQNRVRKPDTPWHQTTIYETHVRGFTIRHPQVPALEQGTMAGLSHQQVIGYLKSLGISSIELLPIHAFIDEHFLTKKGLVNYWGYNSLNFFAPHNAYLATGQINEIRQLVDCYHQAGIEVILDVVYNHTAEGDHFGPTLSFRGIDNASYYRLQNEQPRYYVNDTGCGNTFNISHPRVMQLVLDSLRYWCEDIGIDGFRFDLATVMGREAKGFNPQASLFQAIGQDPLLNRCKLIAEPWDIGPGGYQLGNFPAGWSEWNDNYRDTIRRFWRRDPGQLPTFARRLHGSSDIFEHKGRKPYTSINFITSHDGFTLRDLVSYQQRHNQANGEDNKDGHRENLSENFGCEGPSDHPLVESARWRQQRNFIATLFLSQGVPMLVAGDEMGRSQLGNNNAYCQDNEINHMDWRGITEPAVEGAASTEQALLTEFTGMMLKIRYQHPILSHQQYIHDDDNAQNVKISWLNNDGLPLQDKQWQEHHNYLLGYMLSEKSTAGEDRHYLLVIFNNSQQTQQFVLPDCDHEHGWHWLIDTMQTNGRAIKTLTSGISSRTPITIAARSVAVLCSDNNSLCKEFNL